MLMNQMSSNCFTNIIIASNPHQQTHSIHKVGAAAVYEMKQRCEAQYLLQFCIGWTSFCAPSHASCAGVLPEWLQDLSELSLLDLQGTQLRTDAPAGATGDALLPSWLYFNPADRDLYGSMACPAVVTQPKDTRRQPLKVLVSPFYYRFWGCKCMQGYEAETIEDPEAGGIISMECVHAVVSLSISDVKFSSLGN